VILKEIRRVYSEMFEAEQKVADFILEHPEQTVHMSMAELSAKSGTSDATVVRMCRHIGQSGFYQLKINLAGELSGADDAPKEEAEKTEEVRDVVDFVDEVSRNLATVSKYVSKQQIDELCDAISSAGAVYTFGWGSTYAVAFDFAHRLLRTGVRAYTTESVERMMRTVLLGNEGDLFIAISHSGESAFTIECMKLARMRGMKVALIQNSPDGTAASQSDLTICTNVDNDILGAWGHDSHLPEFLVCDLALYFLREKSAPEATGAGDAAERILAKFKL